MADSVQSFQIYLTPSQSNLLSHKRLSSLERYQINALMKALPNLAAHTRSRSSAHKPISNRVYGLPVKCVWKTELVTHKEKGLAPCEN